VLSTDISAVAVDVAGLCCAAVTVWCTVVWWEFVCVISLTIRKNFKESFPYSILL
jgi:hypothetical protein